MRPPFALLVLLPLAACAGPRPLAPSSANVLAPHAWRDAPAIEGTALERDWWNAFGDPVLSGLVVRALANNPDIAIAAARVEEARALFHLTRAQQLPNISASLSASEQRSVNPFGLGVDQTAGQAQLNIAYDLDLFDRLQNASAAARASLLGTAAAQDGVRLAVASSTAEGYIILRSLDARLAVLRQTLDARSDSLTLATRRFEAGYASQLDLEQSKAEHRATEQLIPLVELAIRRQENGLSLLLGEMPGATVRGVGLEQIATPAIAPTMPSELVRRRPDIAQAEQQLVASDNSLDAARAAFLPSIQLGASGGTVASSLIGDPVSIFSLGGSLLAPIFDSGRLRSQAQGAAARRDQAAYAYQRTVLAAFREVENALADTQRTAEQERSIIAQRTALERALAIATNRYRAGYSPYLEQLDAQRSLLSTELSLVQARADRLTGAVRLYQALGGGWRGVDLHIAAAPSRMPSSSRATTPVQPGVAPMAYVLHHEP